MCFNFSSGDNFTEGVTSVAPIYSVFDNTANGSDKSFTVPAGEMWKIMYANVKLVTSATAGARQLRLTMTDPSGNEVGYISAGAVQNSSLVYNYGFFQGINRETSFIDNMIQVPIPIDLYLPAGSTIRFHDSAAVDPAADYMVVSFGAQLFKGC